MIRIEGLNLTVGTFALRDVELHVAPGEYFVLLGPSGSGKTLLLESLCGLQQVDSGCIMIGDTDVTRLEPRARQVGYLPQDYALFPHLTVRTNVGFGLGHPLTVRRKTYRDQVDRLMAMMDVTHLAHRRPVNLSGGEKQRVALARALAIRPRVLLLDEPVSALDEQTRDSLCCQLKQLQNQFGTTTVHVCHSFAEMMAVADRVGVIHEGRIAQVGTPRQIRERPQTAFIARFVQSGNVFAARAYREPDRIRLLGPGQTQFFALDAPPIEDGADVLLAVRPEAIHLIAVTPSDSHLATARLTGRVAQVTDVGALVQVTLDCTHELQLTILLGKKEYRALGTVVGDRVQAQIDPQDVHILPA